MNIRDIQNRDIVNLENCENEPIHIPGSIQPHGFLIGINPTLEIRYCSANTEEYTGLLPAQMLGKTITQVFGEAVTAEIMRVRDHSQAGNSIHTKLGKADFECTVHLSGDIYIIEAEPLTDYIAVRSHINLQTSRFLSYMNRTETLQQLCQLVADGTRELTGYDRVMIYRFDEDYNGEIFAESVIPALEPFLGLHYPHTDIPAQARKLYMLNHIRMIADIGYKPVPLLTIDDVNEGSLDLSLSMLRSTSPIHVEYLSNMGVGATLTISLIHEDRLWGLIACHHYSPKNLAPEIRIAAKLQGQFITSQINLRQTNEEYEVAKHANIIFERLSALEPQASEESFAYIAAHNELKELCNATGVSLYINGNHYKNGQVPEDEDILLLNSALHDRASSGVFYTHEIKSIVPEFTERCAEISGILYHSLDNGNSIIWYRPETITEVHWGGNPEKAIIRDEQGLHPRKSFELWKEILKCQSKKWLQPEINVASSYAHILQRHIGMVLLSIEEEKYRKLSEKLREANAELENINWISTHDLQEPLRKIQLMSSMLISEADNNSEIDKLATMAKINKAARRMRTLLADILSYTRIQNDETGFEQVALNTIISEVITDFDEKIQSMQADVHVGDMPVVYGVPFMLKQLASNLVRNALQYAAEGRRLHLEISSKTVLKDEIPFHEISFKDNGSGFDQEQSERIFRIFSKLQAAEQVGSGIGLALCKKIVQIHQGSIEAYGVSGQGASFVVYLPVYGE